MKRNICLVLAAAAVLSLVSSGLSGAEKLKLKCDLTIGEKEAGDGTLSGIKNIAVDREGTVYVLDSTSSRIVRFDKNGKFLSSIGRPGQGPGEFSTSPVAIALDPKGNIIVAEMFCVDIFDKAGNFVKKLPMKSPVGDMIVDDKGEIMVPALQDGKIIQVCSIDGEPLYSFGDPMEPPDKWNEYRDMPNSRVPSQLFFTANGNLCFIDIYKYSIYVYSRGKLAKKIDGGSPHFIPVNIMKGKRANSFWFLIPLTSILEHGRYMIAALNDKDDWYWDIYRDGKLIDSMHINEMPLMIDGKGNLYTKAVVNDLAFIKRYRVEWN